MTDAAENTPEPFPEAPAAGPSPREVELEKAVADLKDQLLRTLADTENTRRRLEKDKEDSTKYAVTKFAREMLQVADNLRRALDAVPEGARDGNDTFKSLVVGIEATERQVLSVFEKFNITPMQPMGQVFDPNFHQVMFEIESAEAAPGTVLQVMQAGYLIEDRLLRPALVGVAKAAGAKVNTEA